MSERLVLLGADPTVHPAGSRGEIDLTDGGPIQVAGGDGPQFGAATVELFMAEAEYGANAIDRTFPLRPGEVPLAIMGTDTVSFDDARRRIQAWVGLVQETGRGWVQRETEAGTLYSEVVKAELRLGADNLAAWGLVDANALLTLELNPEWFGDEQLLGSGTITGGGTIELPNVPGDYPARIRAEIVSTAATSQRGLFFAVRPSRISATEAIDIPGAALTPIGRSSTLGDTLRISGIPAKTWTPVCSFVTRAGSPSHVGAHRVKALTARGAPMMLRLEWAPGSAAEPQLNPALSLASTRTWEDLGAVSLPRARSGAQKWIGRLLVYSDTSGTNIDINRILLLPSAYGAGYVNATGGQFSDSVAYNDPFDHDAGSLAGRVAPSGGAWVEAGSSGGFNTDGIEAFRSATGDSGAFQTAGRHAYLDGSTGLTYTDATVPVTIEPNTVTGQTYAAVLARRRDGSNFLTGGVLGIVSNIGPFVFTSQLYVITKVIAGRATVITASAAEPGLPQGTRELRLTASAEGNVALRVDGELVLQAWADADLATGGALASGAAGLYDFCNQAGAVRRYASIAIGATAVTPDAVLYAGRSAELGTNGYSRSDSAGEAFADLVVVGGLPRALPGRSELYVRPTRAMIGQQEPLSTDSAEVAVYGRPCFLFTP